MTGIILDAVLMLLLVCALGYGVRLEKKLSALRAGQLAFAGAVTELNQAAARAESALASLRAAGQETDLLHDRIVKAREVKQQLEALCARGADLSPSRGEGRSRLESGADMPDRTPQVVKVVTRPVESGQDDDIDEETAERIRRMAALLTRTSPGAVAPETPARPAPERLTPVLQALAANQAAQQSLNRARLSLDSDLFAA